MIEKLGLKLLHQFDPERAHGLSVWALRQGLAPMPRPFTSNRLKTSVGGIKLKAPLGLAAGYDKNAEAITALSKVGFGFLEVGAATPRPQGGNPKPRLFRLTEDKGVINRFGFNNQGIDRIAARLAAPRSVPLGLNLGANKDSIDRVDGYGHVLIAAASKLDFATINISSPNTENLRDLQGKAALDELLSRVMETNRGLATPLPIFLKIAPDLTETEIQDIAELALKHKLAAIIATNTTLDREGLKSPYRDEKGGLSGTPVFEKSTRVLAQLSKITNGQIDLVGVGGISSVETAWAKIQAGASALQIYSALVYGGLSLVRDIHVGLDERLKAHGASSVAEAVGSNKGQFL